MDCKEIEQWFIEHEGEPIPEDVSTHLEKCEGCREFREILEALSEPAFKAVPSPTLDEKVQAMVSRQFAWQRRMQRLRRAAIGIAACVIIGLVMFRMMTSSQPGGQEMNKGGVGGEIALIDGELNVEWDSLVLEFLDADNELSELEDDFGSIGRLQAKVTTETQSKNASYGVVFDDTIDLENSMNELEMMVYGL